MDINFLLNTLNYNFELLIDREAGKQKYFTYIDLDNRISINLFVDILDKEEFEKIMNYLKQNKIFNLIENYDCVIFIRNHKEHKIVTVINNEIDLENYKR